MQSWLPNLYLNGIAVVTIFCRISFLSNTNKTEKHTNFSVLLVLKDLFVN